MRRYLLTLALILLVVLTAGGSFMAGRATAGNGTTVTQAVRSDAGTCAPFTATNEIYLVRWTVKGIKSGICVKPDSHCARTAYVGGSVPKTCRDQNE